MTTRGVDPERPICPSCQQHPVPAGRMMCQTCWTLVPTETRRTVAHWYSHWRGDPTDANWSRLMRARQDAVNTITQPAKET